MDKKGKGANSGRREGNEEHHPIRLPLGDYGHQSQSGNASNQNNSHTGHHPQYNTMQDRSVPLSRLRTDGGGYLGPAALDGVNPTFLHGQNAPSNATNNNYDPSSGYSGRKPPENGSVEGETVSYQSEAQRQNNNTCRTRTGCEKVLLMVGSILLMIIVALAAGMIVLRNHAEQLIGLANTCNTRECVKAAGTILESIDESVDPCEDFVQFACGGWYATHPVPEIQNRWSVLDVVDENTLYELKYLLEEELSDDDSFPVKAAKKVYRACVNDSQWSAVGVRPIIDLVNEAGGLPMTDPDWKPKNFKLEETMGWLRRQGGQALVTLSVVPDLKNNSYYVISLMQGYLISSIDILKNASEHMRTSHISYMTRTAGAILGAKGLEENETLLQQASEDAEAIWNLTVALAQISKNYDTVQGAYNPMTIKELTDLSNKGVDFKIDWLSYLHETFKDVNISFNGSQLVVVDNPSYFWNLTRLLAKTKLRTIANFLLCDVIHAMAVETSTNLRDRQRKLEEPLRDFGRTSLRPWYDCAAKTRIQLPLVVGQMFFKNNPIENVTKGGEQLVSDVRDAFRSMLWDATWMSNETTDAALQKINEMLLLTAYPDGLLDDKELEKAMKGLPDVSADDHFGNMMALSRWHSYNSLAKILKDPRRKRWPTGPLEINAYYSSLQNAIVIPGGILQPDFFHPGEMAALNYGGLGAIVGHEITHGFDTNGRNFDFEGRLADWWDDETLVLYLNRSHCFEEQYSSYNVSDLLSPYDPVMNDLKINGGRSAGENIADNGGVRAAWLAYQNHIEKTGEQMSLPGLQGYTQDQLFFITFSRLWCMQFTPWALKYAVQGDIHPPGHFRILGSLQNTEEFAKTFNCPKGSPMNPEKKCVLW